MTKVRLLTALSLGTMLFASCEKQAQENVNPQAVSQSSTASASLPGDWQLVAHKGIVPNGNSAKVTNIFVMLSPCQKDDKLHFESTGELTELAGAVECTAEADIHAKPGSWALSDDQKILTLTQDKAKEFQVTALTARSLKLRSVAAANEPYVELEYTR